jgi:GxxExxY protein
VIEERKLSRKMERGVRYQGGEITEKILKCFYEVYNNRAYKQDLSILKKSLLIELEREGLSVKESETIEIDYRGEKVGELEIGIIVEEKVLIEVTNDMVLEQEKSEILRSKLLESKYRIGLHLNFGNRPEIRRRQIS